MKGFIFPENRVLIFHANCLLRDNLLEMLNPIISGKYKKEKYFEMMSAECFKVLQCLNIEGTKNK